MYKSVFKILTISVSLLLLVKCDNYEFPKSPYPRIETLSVVNISETGVTFQANIIQHGDLPIINHGFVWGITTNLSIDRAENIQLGATAELGNFEVDIKSGLSKNKKYFVRGFVATSDYIVYGEPVSFTSK